MNNALPVTRRPARRFTAVAVVDAGSGYAANTSWRIFARLDGANGHCAQLRDFPCYVKFSREGVRNDAYTAPASCQTWNNARTAAAVNACG